jgi:FKBP-type peptidyl-prolyl cis-trans isomerase FkpA
MKKYLLLLSVVIVGLSACKKVDFAAEQVTIDDAKIQAYIAANPNTAGGLTKDASGMYYKIITPGVGGFPAATSTIKVGYTGKLLNGTTFESSPSAVLTLSGTIQGWQIGLLKVKGPSAAGATDGGKIFMIIPSALAYGAAGSGKIPANSVLIFTVDLNGIGI